MIHVYNSDGYTKASFSDSHYDEVFDGGKGKWGTHPRKPYQKAYIFDKLITLRHEGIGIIVYFRPGDYATYER